MKLTAVIITALITFVCAFAQPSNNIFPWIKPGLVVVYTQEGGAGGGIGTTQGSSVYGTGYTIYFVLGIYEGKVYGLSFTLLSSAYSGIFFNSDIRFLGDLKNGGAFFVNPAETDRTITSRESPPNCRVSGNPGTFILECNIQGTQKKTVISYNRTTGLITENLSMEVDPTNKSSAVSKGRYIKHFYVDVPSVNTFPQIAFEPKIYKTVTQSMIGPLPGGTLRINIKSKQKYVINYEVYFAGSPIPFDAIGIPPIGPHYIHPQFLKRQTILTVPEANFQIVTNRSGYKGSVVVNYIWHGSVVLQQEYDPSTGLKYSEKYSQFMGGFPTHFELVQ